MFFVACRSIYNIDLDLGRGMYCDSERFTTLYRAWHVYIYIYRRGGKTKTQAPCPPALSLSLEVYMFNTKKERSQFGDVLGAPK